MGNPIEQKCPLCGNPATYVFSFHHVWKGFRCKTCIEFYIQGAEAVEKVLEQDTMKSYRDYYSSEARKSKGNKVFVIYENKENGLPSCKWQDRDKLPRSL